MDDQTALGWRYDWFGNLEMFWVKEPKVMDIEQIARRELSIPDATSCLVSFLAEGAFNKVYTVQCSSHKNYIMRIPIPVQPLLKTLSEIATIEYVRRHTDILVPNVIGFDSSCNNNLELEWILMSYVPGSKLKEQWRSMSWLKKELVVRKIIDCLVQLFQEQFNELGNLYKAEGLQSTCSTDTTDAFMLGREHPSSDDEFCLGKVVGQPFFWGNNLKFEVHRGPFQSSQGWLRTILRLHLMAADSVVAAVPGSEEGSESNDSDDEPDPYHGQVAIKARAQRLMDLLPTILPTDEKETFVLHHHDLHANNIFVGEDSEISGIIDWECLPTVPLWVACEIPKFLQTKLNRYLCPDPDEYMKETLDDGSEELNPLYYEHLEENSKMKAAFGEIVAVLEDKSNSDIIDKWLDTVEEHGSAPGIGEMLHAYQQELLDHHSALLKARKKKDRKMTEE